MINVYLVRHGIAVDGTPDEHRALSGEGRARFRKVAKLFAHRDEKVDVIFTSPLVRAVQTAEILASALKHEDVRVLDELVHVHSPGKVLAALAPRVTDGQAIALVGHEPQMSGLLRVLTGITKPVEVKKGAILRLDTEALEPGRAECLWWIRPKGPEVVEGPPLI